MDAINPLKTTGWKRAARVNCTVLVILSVILVGLSSAALSQGFKTALFFYNGTCSGRNVTTVNTVLHLLISVISTLVYVYYSYNRWIYVSFRIYHSADRLASSNFFMQVLNAPSRNEIDIAHAAGSWLDIGVPSIHNAFRLSKFKSTCWVVFVLSSIPIHLLFNSAILRTDYRGAEFHLTIATEDFTKGATYFPPGASLFFPSLWNAEFDHFEGHKQQSISNFDENGIMEEEYNHYGSRVRLLDYDDENSLLQRNISITAKVAGQWTKLGANACKTLYATCQGMSEYGNVVLVANKPGGWVRDEMWKLGESESHFWDQYIPPHQPNHLFFDAQCSVRSHSHTNRHGDCNNNCIGALGRSAVRQGEPGGVHRIYALDMEIDWKNYSFFDALRLEDTIDIASYYAYSHNLYHTVSDFRLPSLDLSIDYCLVQPREVTCRVGVAPALLLIVTLFVITKACTAIIVTTSMSHALQEPLVTPGDAIASFIIQPDAVTAGCCTISHGQVRQAFRSNNSPLQLRARPWFGARTFWASVIPKFEWGTNYLRIIIGISTSIGLLNKIVKESGSPLSTVIRGGFFPSNDSLIIPRNYTLVNSVLLVNGPQLLLTICYFAYNNIFTHLHSGLEWANFGYGFFPLRVTDPKGHQLSTYRLQLPYRYSLPLVAVSILLHWLVANSIYVLISVGGFYGYDSKLRDPSLPDDAAIIIGFSPTALLTMIIVSIILALIPPIWSLLTRLPPSIVVPGCNSLALSAACHASDLSYVTEEADSVTDSTPSPPSASSLRRGGPRSPGQNASNELPGDGIGESSIDNIELVELGNSGENHLEVIAQRKLSWGVIRMSQEWYTRHGYDPKVVGHLGLGTVEDRVAPPLWGHLYG